ncbi:uncharacterized protein GLRG_08729 [Colletotrichum graminicola M1.001]|uniref:PH domain-containing protein n=1 Tax=Colletotrichum graminicola (strain M1.001 / M2 / FGSC 10212) TaxID=645133 RepID=E3QRG2_COLGM|nr:uncharacterized protein GLRG_08729 [Colletotrichum graminicola M1.001]EFQ33450.1 hypothetical protein GLRG_08729 [Colletotrichum graminicola M1.001]
MRNRQSLQTWVESIQTTAQADNEEWRQRIAEMADTLSHQPLTRDGRVLFAGTTSNSLIGQVFLVLREHLGDENLDLAGGVLYELIEIDCDYSDDPGAEFQRWKHDHLNRHVSRPFRYGFFLATDTASTVKP